MTSSHPPNVPGPMSDVNLGPPLFGPDRRNDQSRERLMARVRAEFREMPCLRLTMPQLRRLFGLREDICGRVIATMLREGFLLKSADGRYGTRIDH